MKTIRIMQLYKYYLGRLHFALLHCRLTKKHYADGEISYKRAYKEMNEALRFAWQRYNLCFRLGEMIGDNPIHMKLQDMNAELKELTAWTIE